MKHSRLLSVAVLGLAAVAGSLFFAGQLTRESRPNALPPRAPAAVLAARETAGSPAATAPQNSDRDIASSAAPAATIEPRLLANERRFSRTALDQILPSTTTPADWRTFAPAQLTVMVQPDVPLTFTARSITNDGKRTTWIGESDTIKDATLVACSTETIWNAIISIPGADEHSIQITPELVRIFDYNHSEAVCGLIESTTSALTNASTALATTAATEAAATDSTTLYTSDVLFLYDAATKSSIGTTDAVDNHFATIVTAMNVYLTKSLVDNLQWHFAGAAQAPTYATTSDLNDDIDKLLSSSTELGQFARTQRTLYGADQVQLVISGTRDSAGIAHCPGYLSVIVYGSGSATCAHELAHNFGCRHDRQEAKATDGDGKYYYAHRFTYNGQDVGTIMSYAAYYVPYFSNPTVYDYSNYLGVDADQPKAAYNARWLRENAASIANLIVSKTVTTPVITAQPTAVTITAGNSFSLSVTASGNSLTYQWSKGGVDISGATAATYSKSSATTADTGTYSVLVSNTAGTVRSDAVTVTVNAAPTTTTTSTTSTSSKSGGGGGAFGLISALGLLALISARRRYATA
jgi:hypothetical protein